MKFYLIFGKLWGEIGGRFKSNTEQTEIAEKN